MSETKSYLFYVLDTTARPALLSELLGACRLEVWRPTTWAIRPPGVTMLPFAVWWIFHWLRVFANPGYSVIVVYAGDQLIHRTGVFPRYFRFPFMGRRDLQIGDVWTAPTHRGKGLAAVALAAAIHSASTSGCRLWYVVHRDNTASIRLAEKVGFELHGRGVRTARLGLAPLGCYRITEVDSPARRSIETMAA